MKKNSSKKTERDSPITFDPYDDVREKLKKLLGETPRGALKEFMNALIRDFEGNYEKVALMIAEQKAKEASDNLRRLREKGEENGGARNHL
jgi:uncharacterized protein YdaT